MFAFSTAHATGATFFFLSSFLCLRHVVFAIQQQNRSIGAGASRVDTLFLCSVRCAVVRRVRVALDCVHERVCGQQLGDPVSSQEALDAFWYFFFFLCMPSALPTLCATQEASLFITLFVFRFHFRFFIYFNRCRFSMTAFWICLACVVLAHETLQSGVCWKASGNTHADLRCRCSFSGSILIFGN